MNEIIWIVGFLNDGNLVQFTPTDTQGFATLADCLATANYFVVQGILENASCLVDYYD